MNVKDALERFQKKELRGLSRLISLAENEDEAATEALAKVYDGKASSKVIGLTGPPGAGKSTLTSRFVELLRKRKKTVAVVAVDPVSPFTGGALLGDRIRLVDHFNDPGVFIRSLSTRGKLGGLSLATRQVVQLCEIFGFDYVIVETVGVGQSEVDIRKISDVTLVVLVPEWGDGIQALKSGLLEIGDLFVVNKADREGADRIVVELKNMLQMAGKPADRVYTASQTNPVSTETLLSTIEEFFASESKLIDERRKRAVGDTMLELLEAHARREALSWVKGQKASGKNPYQFIMEFSKARK